MLKREDSTGGNNSQQQQQPADENLSSWAKYLKSKYGKRNNNSSSSGSGNSSSNAGDSNVSSSSISNYPANSTTAKYMQKQSLLLTFGSRGSQQGLFTWPRGIAVGPGDNSIVVADSSNHRVQVNTEILLLNFYLATMIIHQIKIYVDEHRSSSMTA